MKLNDTVYDILKWVGLVFLPATLILFGIIVSALLDAEFIAPIWADIADVVSKIGEGVIVFIGSLLGVSTAEYNKSKAAE